MIPFQIWLGHVTSVIPEERRFTADLVDMAGQLLSCSVEIPFSGIDPEDRDLVVEGAVFYWTFGHAEPAQKNTADVDWIRLRRFPVWTKTRLAAVEKEADDLVAFFQTPG